MNSVPGTSEKALEGIQTSDVALSKSAVGT